MKNPWKNRFDALLESRTKRAVALVLAIIVTFSTTYSMVLPAITLEKNTAETTPGISMGGNEQERDTSASSEEKDPQNADDTDTVSFDAAAKNGDGETETLVHVEADAGAFPEGTTMEASVVTDQDVIDSIADVAEGEVVAVHAVDLTFTDESGETVQPAKGSQVSVTLSPGEGDLSDAQNGEIDSDSAKQIEENIGEEASAGQGTETTVVQYTEEKGAEPVETSDDIAFRVEPENGLDQDNAVSFDMAEQSDDQASQTFAIVETVPDENIKEDSLTDAEGDRKEADSGISGDVTAAEDESVSETEENTQEENSDAVADGGSAGAPAEEPTLPSEELFEYQDGILTAKDESYVITMTYAPEADIPQGAYLQAEEILEDETYDAHLEETRKTLNEAARTGQQTEDGIYAGPEKEEPLFFGTRSLMTDPEAYDRQQAEAASAPEPEIVYARFFDITILDADGNEITPKAPVKVSIELLDTDQDEQVIQNADAARVVHFGEEETEVVAAEALEDTVAGVAFDAEGFSVYGVVYTVDFHSGDYTYSISGGGSITLRELFEILGIEKDADNVENVVSSDPALIWVGKAQKKTTVGALKEGHGLDAEYSAELTEEQIAEINARTVEAGEWVLISTQPFDSEEEMTVTMKDGEVFRIRLTDAQITRNYIAASGETYTITVTYGTDSGIPEGADLEVEEILPDITSSAGDYEAYVSKTENTLGMEEGTAGYIRLFDISIVDKDNHEREYQPTEGSSVAVRIELADSSSDRLNVIHFADGSEEGEEVQSSTENGKNGAVVEFKADGFSVYSIVEAPDPVASKPSGWYSAASLDQIEELGQNGFYVSWNRYYLTGDLVRNVSGNSDRDGLSATSDQYNYVPEDQAAKFYFIRLEGTDTFKIYVEGEGDTKKYVKMTSELFFRREKT